MTNQTDTQRPPATVTAWTAAGDLREDGAHTTIGYVRAGSILVYVYESTVTPGVIVFDIDSGGEGDDLPTVKVVINDDQVWPAPTGPENGCDDCTDEAPCIEHLNDEQDDDDTTEGKCSAFLSVPCTLPGGHEGQHLGPQYEVRQVPAPSEEQAMVDSDGDHQVKVKATDLGCAIADLTAAGKEGHALYRLRDAHRTARAAATS